MPKLWLGLRQNYPGRGKWVKISIYQKMYLGTLENPWEGYDTIYIFERTNVSENPTLHQQPLPKIINYVVIVWPDIYWSKKVQGNDSALFYSLSETNLNLFIFSRPKNDDRLEGTVCTRWCMKRISLTTRQCPSTRTILLRSPSPSTTRLVMIAWYHRVQKNLIQVRLFLIWSPLMRIHISNHLRSVFQW